MSICFYSLLVFLSVFRLSSSDLMKEDIRTEGRNIFLDPIKPLLENCETSLGEYGRCLPLNDCPSLRDYAEGKKKDRLLSVIEHFGCGFRKVVFVCCTDEHVLKPFEGLDHLHPKDHSHTHHFGEYHHHHHHPPEFSQPDKFHGHKKPGIVAAESADTAENERPYKKGDNSHNFEVALGEVNKKPVYEEVDEGDDVVGGAQPKETEETPDWIVVHQTNTPTGGSFGGLGQSTNQYDLKPNQIGSSGLIEPSGYGSGQPVGSTGTFSNGGLFGGQSTFGSGNQGFGINSQSTSGNYDNQGFGTGNSGFGSGLSNLDSQGFGSSRPGSSFSSNQGFSSARPSQSGLNSQGPQVFGNGNQRPTNQGFGSIDRPLSQGFGNERPITSVFGNGRPNAGSSRPSNYDTENSRPGVGRPGNFGGNRPSTYQEGDLFGSGDSYSGGSNNQRPNNQRPNNQGSNKKPNRGGSNKRRLLPDGKCGAEINDKIIGGEDTKLDEFPWMALLHFTTNSGQDRGYGCGGSLINERYVLTAAHCIKGPSLPDNVVVKTVRLGEYDLTKERDCVNDVCSPPPLDVAVEEIIAHPDYKPNDKAQHHDIALIRLRKKVPFSSYVSPICLPGDELKKKDYTGKQMVVAGWGKTSNGVNAKSSAIKQKVSLPFVTLEECKPFYNGINIRLRNTQLCAGGERAKDSCQGDSGGPLMTNEIVNGQPSWFATGIVSFGPEDCGIQNIAGVYTRVSEYVDWILDNIKE